MKWRSIPYLASRLGLAGMLLATALGLLCRARGGDDVLVIASGWPEADRAALESAFRRWIERAHAVTRGPVRVHWVVLMPGDDLARVVRRRAPLDLVLGGPASAFAKLDRQGRLAPARRLEHPSWRVLRRSPIGLAMRSGRTPDQKSQPDATAPAPRPGLLTFDDPRHDPLALAWAEGQLGAASWAEGYARLVRYAGHPRRIGRQEGSALAAVERGEAAMTPAVAPHDPGRNPSLRFLPGEPGPEWVEGVAVVSGGNHPDLARQFLEFLAGRGQAEPPTPVSGADLDASDLLADLLGATLVDAQDELWAAWAKLGRSARPGRAEMWMTRPPPWPPASVEKLLDRDKPSPLLETLVGELAPDPEVRAWLVRSWLGPPRLIDRALLTELAEAADGRLVLEPRFRAWLRGEWTAWARQRYRRVARLAVAGGAGP